jgi:preprotein translocase subunit YajC
MNRYRLLISPLALAAAASAVPALAQAQAPAPAPAASAVAGFNVGATVKDTAGGVVGTVSKVDAQNVTLKTDKHEVPIPRSSFTATKDGLLFGMTRDQFNAAVDAQLAAAQAKMVVGATVVGSAGASVGTIEAMDDQYVTIKLTSGSSVRLPRASVGAGPNGPVIGMTAADLEAAVKAALPAATPAQTPPPASK